MKKEKVPILFFSPVAEKDISIEKNKARKLRSTRWWKQKCAQGRCYYCGRNIEPGELTMDHVVPLIRGGKSTKNNLVPACKECNNKKSYLLPFEWEEYLKTKKEP